MNVASYFRYDISAGISLVDSDFLYDQRDDKGGVCDSWADMNSQNTMLHKTNMVIVVYQQLAVICIEDLSAFTELKLEGFTFVTICSHIGFLFN